MDRFVRALRRWWHKPGATPRDVRDARAAAIEQNPEAASDLHSRTWRI